MPRRKERIRKRRRDRVVDKLRAIIASGAPWEENPPEKPAGFYDILALIEGHFFEIVLDFCSTNDEESQRFFWTELRDDIIAKHVELRPGSRPWGWWKFESTEVRRVVGHQFIMGQDMAKARGQPPWFEDMEVADELKEPCFGLPRAFDGFTYEPQREYLKRLNLLMPGELGRLIEEEP